MTASVAHISGSDTGLKEQKLGGNVYRIDPMELGTRPLWKKALINTGMVLASPLLIPTFVLYTLTIYLGPLRTKNKLLKILITKVMKQAAEEMDSHRRELLQHILPKDKVLDLGAGPGHYLKYLCRARKLVALEPIHEFHEDYKREAVDAGMNESQIEMYDLVVEAFLAQNPKQMGTFDWVILGNVLCEVEDQLSTLHCVDKLLKPGGHVYFSEHIGSPPGTWKRMLQNWINPVWKVSSGGCNCNRDSLSNIRQMPGWQVIFWHYDRFRVALGPFVLGLAMKAP